MGSIKIAGKNIVTQSGSDEPTIASNVVFPAGTMVNFTETTTIPTATQGSDTSMTDMTGSSVDYTPATGSSFVVYTYQTHSIVQDNTGLGMYSFEIDGNTQQNSTMGNQESWGDGNSGSGLIQFRFVIPSYSGSKRLFMQYKVWSSTNRLRLHYAVYPSNVYVRIHRTTYSIM